jgi:dolichol-phosphate mannosyltransferase
MSGVDIRIPPAGVSPEISVVIPVCNECENVGPLAQEIATALAGRDFEILFVDDGSTDDTASAVIAARQSIPQVRLLRHSFRSGQSAAVTTGVRLARAEWVGTLDGDGQNDPADLPKLLAARLASENAGVALFQGHRTTRRDTGFRKLQSRIANGVRSRMLGDGTPDTGCGIKLLHRPTYLELPKFDHMHRFLPALFQRAGARVVSVPVHHRPRARGTSKYGMLDRLWVGIVDIFGVMWLRRRYKPGLAVREE